MKKLMAVLMSTTLFCSLALFTACGDERENIGKMDGDFSTEATDEEFAAALTSVQRAVENNTILGGDMEAADWSFGFDAGLDLDFDMTVSGAASTETVNIDLDAGYQLVIDNAGVAGAGNLSLSGDATNQTNIDYDVGLYNDVEYMYFDMSLNQSQMKFKMTWETLAKIADSAGSGSVAVPGTEAVLSAAADTGADNEGGQGSDSAVSADIAEIIAGLKEAGCKVYIDDSDGLKVKLSVSEDTVDMILAGLGTELEGISEMISFSAFKLDLYFAMTADGVFSQVSADINIDMSMNLGNLGSYDIALSGGVYVKAYDGEVKLPDDLGSYIEQTEVPSLPSPIN